MCIDILPRRRAHLAAYRYQKTRPWGNEARSAPSARIFSEAMVCKGQRGRGGAPDTRHADRARATTVTRGRAINNDFPLHQGALRLRTRHHAELP